MPVGTFASLAREFTSLIPTHIALSPARSAVMAGLSSVCCDLAKPVTDGVTVLSKKREALQALGIELLAKAGL
jgi:hypothetical protein